MVSLRLLRYFASLARHGHFGRAADGCAVTQPALSMQIKDLEREIGAELVERRPGKAALTATGIEVAQRAERILAATRDLVDFARHRQVLSGPLKLGVIPTPRTPISVAFSGPGKKTLYVSCLGALGSDGNEIATRASVRNTAMSIYKIQMVAQGFKGRAK